MVIVEKKFLSGDFYSKYNGVLLKDFGSSGEALYTLEPYEYEIDEAVSSSEIQPYVAKLSESYRFTELNSVPIRLKKDDNQTYYKENIKDVFLYDIQLIQVNKENKQTYGTLKAKIHFSITQINEYESVVEGSEDGSFENALYNREKHIEQSHSVNSENKAASAYYKDSFGCASVIGLLFTLCLVIWLIAIIITSYQVLLPIIGVILAFWLLLEFGRFISSVVKNLLPLIFFLFVGFICYGFITAFSEREINSERAKVETKTDVREKSESRVTNSEEVGQSDLPRDTLISHYRIWNDYKNKQYEGYLSILKQDFVQSKQNRLNQRNGLESVHAWHSLYSNLYEYDKAKLKQVVIMLDSIRLTNKLTERAFADVVVSCIQDIPYVLVHPYTCKEISQYDMFSNQYHRDKMPCMPNTKFGVQAPAEFVSNLNADCDTRTLLLFSILSSFGYDVVILGSEIYSHAVLGINLPAHGSYKMFHGKKYYVWETTAKGMELGQVAPEQKNMNNWDVMLVNTNESISI